MIERNSHVWTWACWELLSENEIPLRIVFSIFSRIRISCVTRSKLKSSICFHTHTFLPPQQRRWNVISFRSFFLLSGFFEQAFLLDSQTLETLTSDIYIDAVIWDLISMFEKKNQTHRANWFFHFVGILSSQPFRHEFRWQHQKTPPADLGSRK